MFVRLGIGAGSFDHHNPWGTGQPDSVPIISKFGNLTRESQLNTEEHSHTERYMSRVPPALIFSSPTHYSPVPSYTSLTTHLYHEAPERKQEAPPEPPS